MEAIEITTNEQGVEVITARHLHEKLGLNKAVFSRWAKKNITNSPFAIKDKDWSMLNLMLSNGNIVDDYVLTTDFSERLAMMARTEQGEEVRKYFIERRNKLNEIQKQQAPVFQIPQTLSEALLFASKVVAEKEKLAFELELKTEGLNLANETIKEQAPSVAFVEKVLQSKTTYTTNQVALGVGMTAQKLNTVLQNKGILYKQSGSWHLYGNYRNKGYAEQRTHTYYNSKNEPMTSTSLVWTEAGRKFIHEQLNSNLNFALVQTQTSTTA